MKQVLVKSVGVIIAAAAFGLVACCDTSAVYGVDDFDAHGCKVGEIDKSAGIEGRYLQLLTPESYIETVAPATGKYDIDICYLDDTIHQTTYSMSIAGEQVVSWLNKNRDGGWSLLSGQNWHSPKCVEITKGDTIRISASFENGSAGAIHKVVMTPTKYAAMNSAVTAVENTHQREVAVDQDSYVTIRPARYTKAFKNPLKGFRPNNIDHQYATLTKTYLKWKDLERTADDGIEQIIKACDKRWEGFAENNVKAIPRVYLEWPDQDGGWAEDMAEGDYTSDAFKTRVLAMIQKLGKAWDNDPRVAYVEMGLIGEWGEMEFPATTAEIREAMGAQFAESFKNKLVMIRWPNTYDDHIHNFGYYWDSFAHYDQEYYTYMLRQKGQRWATSVIGGEAAYNWGNDDIQPGESPDESLSEEVHLDYVIDRIMSLHTNHLGWISSYDEENEAVAAGADRMQQAFGYRFVIDEFSYPKRVECGEPFRVSFSVQNIGSTPLYYNWPVEIALLDAKSHEVAWRTRCEGIDIRKWLPGDKWNNDTNKYEVAAKEYFVEPTLNIENLEEGNYIISVAILDPAGDLPSVRFAVENYYNGGRHPMGTIGVGCDVQNPELSDFDDLRGDNTLHYKL